MPISIRRYLSPAGRSLRFRFVFGLLAVLVGLGMAVSPAAAQTNTTALTGIVSDSEGLRLPGSRVTLLNAATGNMTTQTTGGQGEFSFTQILPGHYQVTVHRDGFKDNVQTLDLFIATPLALNVQLSVGTTTTTAVVEADLPNTLNQVDASLGKPFDNLQVETLPYLANNTLSLLALQPGVLSFDASNTLDPRTGTINGARQDQSDVTLDGVDDNESNYDDAFSGVLRATRDSIEEFRVTTAGADADAGRTSGAQVALQTKSGTNQIHGTAYYYYRDPAAASNNWFYKQSELTSKLPNISAKVLQDTYGATLGLPIIHNKLFFFGAYEGYKQASDSVVTQEVPLGSGDTADSGVAPGLRNGTLTYLNTGGTYTTLTPAQIAAMDAGCTAGGGCPNGPGVNAAMLAYLRAYPLANGTSLGDGHNTGSFVFVSPSPISNITNIVRLDYNLTSKQSLFFRGNLQSDNTLATAQFPGGIPTSSTFGNDRGFAVGHIWSINDHLTNNARYGWTRYGNNIQGGVHSNYITFQTANGQLTPQAPTTTSNRLVENTSNFDDDVSWVKGRHTIQFGFDGRLIYNDRLLNATQFSVGQVTVYGLAKGAIANTGTNLDASAAGYPTIATSFDTVYDFGATELTGLTTEATEYQNYSVSGNSLTPLAIGVLPTHRYKSFEQEYYVQDQFRVTPKLLLTAGLRYAFLGVPYETNGQQVRLSPGPMELLKTRVADAAQGTSYNPQLAYLPGGKVNNAPGFWTAGKLNFAPRLSFNYSPDGKTSLSGGFMLAFDHFGQALVDYMNDSGSFGLSSSYTSVSTNQTVNTSPRFTNATTVPTQFITAPPTGPQSFPLTNAGGPSADLVSIDDQLRAPYAEIFDLSLQRELHRGLVVTASYTGRLGRHLIGSDDTGQPINLYDTVSGQTWFQAADLMDKAKDAGTPIAAFPNIPYIQDMFPNTTYTSGGTTYKGTQAVYGQLTRGNDAVELYTLDHTAADSPAGQTNRFFLSQAGEGLQTQATITPSSYNAFQLSLRHTLAKDFLYDFNYTYSHSLDEVSEPERGSSATSNSYSTGAPAVINNSFNPAASYGSSDFDIRHSITADWTLALPYGHGQRFGATTGTLMNEALGGWNLSGIAKWTTGLPWSVLSAAGAVTGWEFRSWDVQIAPTQDTGHHAYVKNSNGSLTPNAFQNGGPAAYASFRLPYAGESGNRNNMRADGYFSVDPGISKVFPIHEKQSLRITVEAFNVLNASRFTVPPTGNNGRSGASSFGNYTALINSPRQLQFSGRYYF